MTTTQRMTIGLIVLASVLPAEATAKSLTRVRYSTGPDHTRVVIDATHRCDYQVSAHHDPERIAINVRGVKAAKSLTNLSINKGGVRRVRVNRLSWGTQVVIDLQDAAEWRHFRLGRNGKKPERIVLDVSPRGGGEAAARSAATRRPDSRATPADGERPIVVAIDAGHGGRDPGAVGRYGLVEKAVVLDLSRRIASRINEEPGFKAVLTRRGDEYIDLERRMEIARRLGADVFVSIHLNTARNRSARGAEIYFVSPAGAARTASRVLANPRRAANDFGLQDASSDLLHMLVDMNEQSTLQRSEALAASILDALSRTKLLPTRAVKQKSYQVLRTIAMPSVLVEAGFIANAADAKMIKGQKGRDALARAVARGVVRFLRESPPQRTDGESLVVHRVRRGETLWRISRQYRTTVAKIRKTNNLRSSVLRVGQELLVSKGY